MDQTPITALDDASLDSLATAHTRTVDALAGFETMVDRAEPEFRPVAERFRDLHRSHAARLADLLRQNGREPDTDGSFMGTVNKVVVATRSFFDEIDQDVMQQVRSGEGHVVQAYRDAESHVPYPKLKSIIAGLRTELEELLAASPS